MAQVDLTPAHKEILRLVASFKGLYGPMAIDAAMSVLSRFRETEWAPIVEHLEALMRQGYIRLVESTGTPRLYLTKDGERAVGG
jgi:hypothetical protein